MPFDAPAYAKALQQVRTGQVPRFNRRLTVHPFETAAASVPAGRTYGSAFELEAHFDWVRIAAVNNSLSVGYNQTAAVAVSSSAVVPGAGTPDLITPYNSAGTAGTWTAVTWDNLGADSEPSIIAGSATTLAAANMPLSKTVAGSGLPSFAWSDWMPLSSIPRIDVPGARPLLLIRQYSADAAYYLNHPGIDWHTYSGGLYPAAPIAKGFFKSGDFVTAPTGMTWANSNNTADGAAKVCYMVQYMSWNGGITTMTVGDSISEGLGSFVFQNLASLSASGTTGTAVVADGTKWAVSDYLIIQGTGTSWDGSWSVNSVATNTITFTISTAGTFPTLGAVGQAGYSSTSYDSYLRKAASAISTQGLPVQHVNMATRGNPTTLFDQRAIQAIQKTKPDIVFVPGMSTNNGLTVANGETGFQHYQATRRAVEAYGGLCVLVDIWPNDRHSVSPNNGQEQRANLIAGHARYLAAIADGALGLSIFEEFSQGSDVNIWKPGKSYDGVHPAPASHTEWGTKAAALLQSVLMISR